MSTRRAALVVVVCASTAVAGCSANDTTSNPTSNQQAGSAAPSSGQSLSVTSSSPAEDVGTWTGHTRQLTINPDGTGQMVLDDGCCSGATYELRIAPNGADLIATVVSAVTRGDQTPADSAQQGDTIQLHRESGPAGGMVVTMPSSAKAATGPILFCSSTDPTPGRCGA